MTEEPVKILLVDDNEANLTALEATLRAPEYALILAKSGHEALLQVLRHDFAVILLDVAMPGLDGFETAAMIKGRERSSRVPIIFVTASIQDVAHVYQGYSVGAVDYLYKPVETHVVRSKVAVFVELFRQRKQIERQAERLRDMERQQSEAASRLLADAGALLLHGLDPDGVLPEVADFLTRDFCDACVVLLDGESHAASRAPIVSSRKPGEASALLELLKGAGLSRWLASLPAVPPHPGAPTEPWEPRTVDAAFTGAEELRDLGFRAGLAAELADAGRRQGILLLLFRRMPGPDAPRVSRDLAQRISFAVQNASLFRDAQEAVRLRDEFLSIASHELRTPLTALHLNIDALARREQAEPALAAAQRESLRKCVNQVRRLGDLVNGLLDVSRIRSGRLSLKLERTDLGQVVQEIIERLAEEIDRAGCPLRVEIEGTVVGAWDRLRCEQLVTNLISNALKYARGGGVEVRVRHAGATALLSVRDEGIGIPPAELERIFGRFERAAPGLAYGGLGLGLYITRQIARAHGGEIRAESRPGEGSTFTVELPLDPPNAALPGPHPAPTH